CYVGGCPGTQTCNSSCQPVTSCSGFGCPLDIEANPGPDSWDDLNGIYKNPMWHIQITRPGFLPHVTSETLCTHVGDDKTQIHYWSGGARPCTSQPIGTVWGPFFTCPYGGHVNWMSNAVANSGIVTWDGFSSFDDDYNFKMHNLWNGLSTD